MGGRDWADGTDWIGYRWRSQNKDKREDATRISTAGGENGSRYEMENSMLLAGAISWLSKDEDEVVGGGLDCTANLGGSATLTILASQQQQGKGGMEAIPVPAQPGRAGRARQRSAMPRLFCRRLSC